VSEEPQADSVKNPLQTANDGAWRQLRSNVFISRTSVYPEFNS
jgi:hypothetical protein